MYYTHKYRAISLLIIAFIFLISAGCGNSGIPKNTTDASSTSSEHSSTSEEQTILQTSWDAVNVEDVILPSVPDEDFIFIPEKNYNIIEINNIECITHIPFDIITTHEITGEVTAKADTETPISVFLQNVDEIVVTDPPNNTILPYYVFQSYQNFDWKLMYSFYLEHTNMHEPLDYQPYYDYRDLYVDAYTQIESSIKKLYHYRANVNFETYNSNSSENEEINKITFTVDGIDYDVQIGKIVLDYETNADIYSCESITPISLWAWGKCLLPNNDGILKIDDMNFKCNNEITITGFSLLNAGVEIAAIDINRNNSSISLNQSWDGEPMTLSEGTTVNPIVTINDPDIIGKLSNYKVYYLIMEYEVNGTKYSTDFSSSFFTNLDQYEIYAAEVDGIDILSYYIDYYTLTQN